MKKVGTIFIKNLRYLCLVGVIALGFMTIVATGGGGGGNGSPPKIIIKTGTTDSSGQWETYSDDLGINVVAQTNDENGVPIQNLNVEYCENNGKALIFVTDPNGYYQSGIFEGPLQNYIVQAPQINERNSYFSKFARFFMLREAHAFPSALIYFALKVKAAWDFGFSIGVILKTHFITFSELGPYDYTFCMTPKALLEKIDNEISAGFALISLVAFEAEGLLSVSAEELRSAILAGLLQKEADALVEALLTQGVPAGTDRILKVKYYQLPAYDIENGRLKIGMEISPEGCGPDYPDQDDDGWNVTFDCDDHDNTIYPGAQEICDGKDNDCDDEIDEGCDFEGTWLFHLLTTGDFPQYVGWAYGTEVIDANGNCTCIAINRSNGDPSLGPAYTMVISSSGSITIPGSDFHGIMNSRKDTITGVMTDGGGGYDLMVFTKQASTSYNTTDLQGTWRYNGLISGDAPNQTPGWYWGEFTFDQNGSLTNATPITDSLGNSDYTPSDPGFNLSSDGIITISGLSGRGVMNDNKDMIVAVTTMCPGRNTDVCGYNLLIMVKEGGASFSTADLAGTWFQHHITSGDSPQLLIWCYSSGIMNSAGNFTFTGACSDGDTTKSGTFGITNDGIVTIMGEASSHGVMSSDKKLIVFTFDDGGGGYGLMMLVKRD